MAALESEAWMSSNLHSDSDRGFLPVVVVALVITLFIAIGAAIYFYRTAERSKLLEALASAEAAASVKNAQVAQQRIATAEQHRDDWIYFVQYYEHVVGVDPLSDAELMIVRASISLDERMAVVLQTFEKDMASVNELLPPDRQVSNYHDGIVACRKLLERDGN
jgi:hypothetical protein